MHRPTYPHGNPSFDGPGARNIVGEPGPSTILAAAEYPSHQQASPLQQHRAGHSIQHFPQQSHAQGHFREQVSPTTPAHFSAQYSSPAVRVEAVAQGPSAAPLSTGGATAPAQPPPVIKRVGGKANVSSACGPCKRAHLACDVARPCKRCVNMGKPELCADVPHKKRGRPKVIRTPAGEPYTSTRPPRRPPTDTGSSSKWRPPSTYEPAYVTSAPSSSSHGPGTLGTRLPSPPRTASLGPVVGMSPMDSAASMSPFHPGAQLSMPSNMGSAQENLFTLFCSTELKIIRATSLAHSLTGHHLHEFANVNLLDWLHPSDRHLIEMERSRLVTVPYLPTQLQSSRETHAAIMTLGERELQSPADGMRDTYPQQNVRFLRSDGSFGLFNLRLHLGGGLGGSLWHPDSLGKIYIVVSCLLIGDRDVPPDISARRPQAVPLTPVTPMAPPQPHQLPGFSSIAAAADAPPRPETAPTMSTAQSPYTYGRTGVSTPVAAPPPQQSYNMYARPPSQPQYPPVQPPGRTSPSTSQTGYPLPLPRTPVYSDPSGGYAPPPPSGYYQQAPPQAAPYDPNIRRDPGAADEWMRRGGAGGSVPLPPPTGTDYSRRTWEL